MIIPLAVGFIKKTSLHKVSYFPEPYRHSKNQTKVELDLSNYATKSDLKSATSINIKLGKKTNLHIRS